MCVKLPEIPHSYWDAVPFLLFLDHVEKEIYVLKSARQELVCRRGPRQLGLGSQLFIYL